MTGEAGVSTRVQLFPRFVLRYTRPAVLIVPDATSSVPVPGRTATCDTLAVVPPEVSVIPLRMLVQLFARSVDRTRSALQGQAYTLLLSLGSTMKKPPSLPAPVSRHWLVPSPAMMP